MRLRARAHPMRVRLGTSPPPQVEYRRCTCTAMLLVVRWLLVLDGRHGCGVAVGIKPSPPLHSLTADACARSSRFFCTATYRQMVAQPLSNADSIRALLDPSPTRVRTAADGTRTPMGWANESGLHPMASAMRPLRNRFERLQGVVIKLALCGLFSSFSKPAASNYGILA